MKHVGSAGIALVAGLSVMILAQEPAVWQEARPRPSADGQTTGEAAKPLSQSESEAWKLIEGTSSPLDKANLARQFLVDYPQSEFVPTAHYFIAQSDFRSGDTASFVDHAEKAVAALPNAADLLSELAFVYAEGGKADLAIDRANQALSRIDSTERPSPESASSWILEVYHVRAEAYYALGRAYLGKSGQEGGKGPDPNLSRAVNYLEAALRNNPRHDYAALRLAFAQRNLGNLGKMLHAYGRAVAIQGIASQPAREQLEEVLGIIKSKMADSEWAAKTLDDIVAEARMEMDQELAALRESQSRELQSLGMARADERAQGAPKEPIPQP